MTLAKEGKRTGGSGLYQGKLRCPWGDRWGKGKEKGTGSLDLYDRRVA